jgi:hypothetical protein
MFKKRMVDTLGNVVPHKKDLYTTLKRFKYPKLPEGKKYYIYKPSWATTALEVRICWTEQGLVTSEPFCFWTIEYT